MDTEKLLKLVERKNYELNLEAGKLTRGIVTEPRPIRSTELLALIEVIAPMLEEVDGATG